jgi:hypothetical protein
VQHILDGTGAVILPTRFDQLLPVSFQGSEAIRHLQHPRQLLRQQVKNAFAMIPYKYFSSARWKRMCAHSDIFFVRSCHLVSIRALD